MYQTKHWASTLENILIQCLNEFGSLTSEQLNWKLNSNASFMYLIIFSTKILRNCNSAN
jgi:hypothetical protein